MKITSEDKMNKLEISFVEKTSKNTNNTFDELPDVAIKLLSKSKKEILNGDYKTHEQVMRASKEKYNLI